MSGFSDDGSGTLQSLGNTATDAGTVDATFSPGGHHLYVETGIAGIVDEYQVAAGGALTRVGSVPVPDAIGAIGRLVPEDVAGLVRYIREHAPVAG